MSKDRICVTKASMPPYEEYVNAIKPLWESCWITNMGKYHKELEIRLKEYLKVSELSLMVNGHMSLEMIIRSFEFEEGAEPKTVMQDVLKNCKKVEDDCEIFL